MRRAKVLRLPTAGPQDAAPLATAIDSGELDPAPSSPSSARPRATAASTISRATTPRWRGLSGRAPGTPEPRSSARRLRHVGRHRRRALAASPGFCARRRRRAAGRPAPRHRHRPYADLQAGGDRPRAQIEATARPWRAAMKDAGIADRRRRAFRADQMSAAHQGARRGGERRGARSRPRTPTIRWRYRAVLRRSASRGTGRIDGAPDAADLPDWSLFSRSPALGRRRAAAQRDRRAGQLVRLGGRPGDRARRDEGRHRRRAGRARRGLGRQRRGETGRRACQGRAAPSGQCAACATPCSTTATSIRRATRAPWSAACWPACRDTLLYVSGGAEHQGPAGGGPVAIIGKVSASQR